MKPSQASPVHPRKRLMDAALELIGEQSPYNFSLSAVVRRARLPAEVLEQHFASRDDLILAIAEEGYAQLAETMEQWMTRGGDVLDRLNLGACAYVDFALDHPAHYAVMFELPPPLRDQKPCEPPHMNAFGVLVRAIEQAQAERRLPAGDAASMALRLWPLVHGIAKLALARVLAMPREVLLAYTRRAAETMTRGLSQSDGA